MRQFFLIVFILIILPANAQHISSHSSVTETGQATFAAISEIVSALKADPNTDWSKVNIDALRDHLIDMDLVTMHSSVKSKSIENGMTYEVTGEGDVITAIQRMTAAHGSMLKSEIGWEMISIPIENGANVRVTSASSSEVQKINALGFYGIMTVGAHHQLHHLMMASGQHPH